MDINKKGFSRREFIKVNSLAGAGLTLGMGMTATPLFAGTFDADKPAVLGGKPLSTRDWQKMANMESGDG